MITDSVPEKNDSSDLGQMSQQATPRDAQVCGTSFNDLKCYEPQHGALPEYLARTTLTQARQTSHNDSTTVVPDSPRDQGNTSLMTPNTGSGMSIMDTRSLDVAGSVSHQVRIPVTLELSARQASDSDDTMTVQKSVLEQATTSDIMPKKLLSYMSIMDPQGQDIACSVCHEVRTSTTLELSCSVQHVRETSQELLKDGIRVVSKRSPEQIAESRCSALKRLKVTQELRPHQREAMSIISEAQHHAFIIMPTGSGKTTLMHMYKPRDTCSLVFAPFKVLVQQLGKVLAQKGKAVLFPSDEDLFTVLATADFIILPYEAAPTSADLVSALSRMKRLGPIWVDEVHNLTTASRFRLSLDSFWNLQAELQTRGLSPKMIGLSATLRPDDVPDVMRRLSISNVDVYRRSCHRAELGFKFEKPFQHEKTMFDKATELAIERSKEGKVMVFASTVNICEIMMEKIQSKFKG